jgi:hypothetical protein
MSEGAIEEPNNRDIDLLADLLERAQQLPEGAERIAALNEIKGFQERLIAFFAAR